MWPDVLYVSRGMPGDTLNSIVRLMDTFAPSGHRATSNSYSTSSITDRMSTVVTSPEAASFRIMLSSPLTT
jgi:hypothetical protein